jgi:hypothetical protein
MWVPRSSSAWAGLLTLTLPILVHTKSPAQAELERGTRRIRMHL